MIVTMVVRAQEHWYVPAAVSAVAVISKYAIRTRSANVFNPAAFALVSMMYLLPMGQSWWGALPGLRPCGYARPCSPAESTSRTV